MRSGGSKQKGSEFERKVCKELSLWISLGKQEDVFWRSAMSGGRSTVAIKKGKRFKTQAGDISAIDSLGNDFINRFIIECKFYKKLDLDNFIKGTGKLLGFWHQLLVDSAKYEKYPILIAKQNNHPVFVCLSRSSFKSLRIRSNKIRLIVKTMYVILYDDLLKVDPTIIRL